MGDSIVADTMRSAWLAKLAEAYPKAKIRGTVYVRGGGGCQHYKEEGRIAKNVVPRKPDLVFIGGISQKDIESIREVHPPVAGRAAGRGNPAGHRHVRHHRSARRRKNWPRTSARAPASMAWH